MAAYQGCLRGCCLHGKLTEFHCMTFTCKLMSGGFPWGLYVCLAAFYCGHGRPSCIHLQSRLVLIPTCVFRKDCLNHIPTANRAACLGHSCPTQVLLWCVLEMHRKKLNLHLWLIQGLSCSCLNMVSHFGSVIRGFSAPGVLMSASVNSWTSAQRRAQKGDPRSEVVRAVFLWISCVGVEHKHYSQWV